MRPRRLLTLAIPFLLLAIPAILIYRQVTQARLDHALILHIKADDAVAVIADLQHGADLNARATVDANLSWRETLRRIFTRSHTTSRKDRSALHIALGAEQIVDHNNNNPGGEQNVAIVKALVKAGADANALDSNQQTPLHMAVIGNDLDSTRLLLEHGADVNALDKDGWTPLYHAVRWKYGPLTSVLIQHHADVNLHDDRSVSPLAFASASRSLECIKILKQAGARF